MATAEAKIVVAADDRATPVIRKISAEINGIASVSGKIFRPGAGAVGSSVGAVGASAAKSAAQVNRLHGALRALEGLRPGITALAGSLAAIGIAAAAGGVKAAADYKTLIARMRAGGLNDGFVTGVESASASLTQRFPNLGKEDVAGLAWPVRRISSGDEDALGRLEDISRVAAAWKASGGTLEKFGEILKAADILDLGRDRKTFNGYLEGQLKAFQSGGGALRPEDAKLFADMSKGTGATLSPRFLSTTAPIMSDAAGGGKFGNAINQLAKGIISPTTEALATALELGLVHESDLIRNKKGNIQSLKPGHFIAGAQQAISDPDLWVWNMFGPALSRRGIKPDTPEFARAVQSFGGPSTADDALGDLLNQEKSIRRQQADMERAWGSRNIEAQLRESPGAAGGAVAAAGKDLGATLMGPLVEQVTAGSQEISAALVEARQKIEKADRGEGGYAAAAGEFFSRLWRTGASQLSPAPALVEPSRELTADERAKIRLTREMRSPGPQAGGTIPDIPVPRSLSQAPGPSALSVQGTVAGEATVSVQPVTVTVQVGLDGSVRRDVQAMVERAVAPLRGELWSGGPGSTGASMPEAKPGSAR